MITTLKEMFPEYLIAFSDHSPGWEMDVAAISLGVGMIEKTITEIAEQAFIDTIASYGDDADFNDQVKHIFNHFKKSIEDSPEYKIHSIIGTRYDYNNLSLSDIIF